MSLTHCCSLCLHGASDCLAAHHHARHLSKPILFPASQCSFGVLSICGNSAKHSGMTPYCVSDRPCLCVPCVNYLGNKGSRAVCTYQVLSQLTWLDACQLQELLPVNSTVLPASIRHPNIHQLLLLLYIHIMDISLHIHYRYTSIAPVFCFKIVLVTEILCVYLYACNVRSIGHGLSVIGPLRENQAHGSDSYIVVERVSLNAALSVLLCCMWLRREQHRLVGPALARLPTKEARPPCIPHPHQ